MPRVHFIDVTNRDGVQTSRIKMSKFQKTVINWYLARLGVHQSEIGFPFLSHEWNYITAQMELQRKGVFGKMALEGWCRANVRDIEAGLRLGLRDFNISISTSDQMIQHKFLGKLDRHAILREMENTVLAARNGGARTVGVNAEDASRTDLAYLIEFAQRAASAGADRFRYCDTMGCESPHSIYERVRTLAEKSGIGVELHCHNDLGMANANSTAGAKGAMDGGVDAYINATVNGLGERAGQADLLSCILAFKYGSGLRQYVIGDPLDLKVAYKMAGYCFYAFGLPCPINQPGVGENAFAHEAGIHADGALKDRHNYELYDYEILGRGMPESLETGRVITTGEYGGIKGFRHVCRKLGLELPSDEKQVQGLLELTQYLNAHNQKPLLPDEIELALKHPSEIRKILTVEPQLSCEFSAAGVA
ncbi:MAG: homocitrate synthase [Armatimonadetes bacterium]|nr:homocitrate synthase [Armatimonadota bacterium]